MVLETIIRYKSRLTSTIRTHVIVLCILLKKKNTINTRILESRETCNSTMRASGACIMRFGTRLVRCLCIYVGYNKNHRNKYAM